MVLSECAIWMYFDGLGCGLDITTGKEFRMKFHTFGSINKPKIILIHGTLTPWQMWETQIEYYKKKYCVIVPALNGHQEEQKSEFYSIEQEAQNIEKYCIDNNIKEIFAYRWRSRYIHDTTGISKLIRNL